MTSHADRRRGRRRLMPWLTALVLAVLVAGAVVIVEHRDEGSAPGPTSAGPGSADRPNIVLIMTDDMWGKELRYLPRTRRLLGGHGVTFSDFTAPQPLCCPSRAQMLTGQYAQNNGVHSNSGALGGYQAFHPETALPVWLHDSGYQTAMVGKYLNEYPQELPEGRTAGTEPGWDHWDPTIRQVYSYFGYTQENDGNPIRPPEYHTDYVTQASDGLIDQMSAQEQPFFLWTSYVAPHSVCKVVDEVSDCNTNPPRPGRYRSSYPHYRGLTESYPSFNEQDMSDKPPFLRRRAKLPEAPLRLLQRRRAQALESVDHGVAHIVKTLRRDGELDNTLVLFTSDNGYLIGQHRYEGKVLGYEEAVKVPLLMRGLGLPSGVVDRRSYAMIDLAPTFAALAGVSPMVPVDGEPIVVRNGLNRRPPDRTLLIQAGSLGGGDSDDWLFRGVRTRRYTYVHWRGGFQEIYDRRHDPYELRNLDGHVRYARVERTMRYRTKVLGACSGDTCRTAFPAPPQPLRAAQAQARLSRRQ